MTGRERALRALNLEPVDRVPLLGGFAPHAAFLEAVTGRTLWDDPVGVALEAYRRVGADLIPQLVLPQSPREYRCGDPRDTHARRQAEFPTLDSVVAYIDALPSSSETREGFDWDEEYGAYVTRMTEMQDRVEDDILWIGGFGMCSFMWYSLFGYENYFMLMALHPGHTKRLFEHDALRRRMFNEVVVAAIQQEGLPPFVYGGQDICGHDGPMVSMPFLEEVYFPFLRWSIEPLLDAGIDIVWHCDGDIRPIVPLLIDMGVAGFQGFEQEAGVDIADMARLRTRWGKKPILWGSISVTTTLPFGTVDDVRREVERCVEVAAPGGGFVLAPTSSVLPEVPVENILAMYEHGATCAFV